MEANIENKILLDAEVIPATVAIHQDCHFTDPDLYSWIQPGGYLKYIFSAPLYVLKSRLCSAASFQYIPQFTIFPDMYKTGEGQIRNIISIIRIMRGGKLKEKTESIQSARLAGNTELKRSLKATLPCFPHSGVFIPRENAGLVQPGFTYQLDIDGLSNASEVLDKIIADKNLEILFASISPSGNGIKGLLFLRELMFLQDSWTYQEYRNAYHQATTILFDYFQKNHGVNIDRQMKAISQPFYLFHAPKMFIHKNLLSWV
jgi:hypothetical protein